MIIVFSAKSCIQQLMFCDEIYSYTLIDSVFFKWGRRNQYQLVSISGWVKIHGVPFVPCQLPSNTFSQDVKSCSFKEVTKCHNEVLKSLSCTLENKWAVTNSLPPAASNPLRTTMFVHEGAKLTRSGSTSLERGQLHWACNWKMLVDTGQQLVFPPEIANITLRPDLVLWSPSFKNVSIIELTVPWEDSVDEAHELKHLYYVELAAEAQHHGWNTEVRPVEVSSTTRIHWRALQRRHIDILSRVFEI